MLIPQKIIHENVDNDTYQKFIKFYKTQSKLINNNNRHMVPCPYPNCSEIVEADPTNQDTFIQCDNYHKFCSKCKLLEWHDEGACDMVRNFYFF
jgi:hypothetical protein